ncbi:MAG TPA: hypothetical protein VEB20_20755 [Azospirillaceae bacterium]|nr:hypothetical protein [Azospirillaceae bacterium]
MRRLPAILAAPLAAALLLLPAAAGAIEGRYRIDGRNPGEAGGRYGGEVAVAKAGDTYQVAWAVGGQKWVGTGIVTGKVLSVVYGLPTPNGGLASPGVAAYEINPDGTLTGGFALLGTRARGVEAWIPAGR